MLGACGSGTWTYQDAGEYKTYLYRKTAEAENKENASGNRKYPWEEFDSGDEMHFSFSHILSFLFLQTIFTAVGAGSVPRRRARLRGAHRAQCSSTRYS